MADFYQTGVVTTLHRLTPDNIERLEADLEKFSQNKPIGLVLPALYSEFETSAMQHIVPELQKVRYLQRIVVVLARATSDEFERACRFFQSGACRPGPMVKAAPAGWHMGTSWRCVIAQ